MQRFLFSLIGLSFFITAFFLAAHIQSIPKALAANITATWKDAQTIVITGDFTGTLVAESPDPNETAFRGKISTGCVLRVIVRNNQINFPPPPQGGIGAVDPAMCRGTQYETGETHPIGGTKPGTKPKETQDQKKVDVSLESNQPPESSPNELTITIKDAKGKVVQTRKVKKELKCQGFGCDEKPPTNYAYYGTTFYLGPGKYSVCFSAIDKTCHSETKKEFTPAIWAYGEAYYFADINVGAGISMLTQLGQSCKTEPYTFQLKQNGKVIQTITTEPGEHKASDEEENSLGGLNDIIIGVSGKFTNVKPGDYQVCLVSPQECKDVKKPLGGLTSPDPVHFDVKLSDSSNVCGAIGDDATPWPTNPPPPSPPCTNFVDGECKSVKTAFGDISTKPGEFITKVFGILLSMSGGLALFLIMRASYIIMTSRGKPEQLQNGRDQMIAAIVGLLFLIFSFVILQVISTDILKIPTDTAVPNNAANAPAAVTHGVGGSCGLGAGATCKAGLTCDTSKDTSRECKRLRDCVGVCKK